MIAIEFLSWGWEIDFDCDLILEYEKTRYLTFQRNRKNALLFKEALGNEINGVISDGDVLSEENLSTRFKVAEISVRNEPDGSQKHFSQKWIGV